jgi:hypothetical protein
LGEVEPLDLNQSMAMTTSIIASRPVSLVPISSNERDLWNHPMLDLYRHNVRENIEQRPLLYSIPSTFDEDYDPEFAPHPTSAAELPDLQTWTLKFAISVLEIWSAKRQPAQLARWCHHTIYSQLVTEYARAQSPCGSMIVSVRLFFGLRVSTIAGSALP